MYKAMAVLSIFSLLSGCTESDTTGDGGLEDGRTGTTDVGIDLDGAGDTGDTTPDASTPDAGVGFSVSLFNEILSSKCPSATSHIDGSVTESWSDCPNNDDTYLLAYTQLFSDPSGTTSDRPFHTFFFLTAAGTSWLPDAVPPRGALELFLINPEQVTVGTDIDLGPGQLSWMQTPPPPLTDVDPTTPTTRDGAGVLRFSSIPNQICGSFVGHVEAELKYPDSPDYCHGVIQVSIDFTAPWLPDDFFAKPE